MTFASTLKTITRRPMKSKVKRQFGNNEYKSRHQLKRKQENTENW